MKTGNGPRRFPELPRVLELALFSYWVFFCLHLFYSANPVDFRRIPSLLAPSAPATAFAWANLLARTLSSLAGHAGCLAWMVAAFGMGLAASRLLAYRRRPVSMDGWLVTAGIGAASVSTLMLGLGLAGLWYPALAWVVVAGGAACVLLDPRFRRWPVRGSGEAAGWVLLGPTAELTVVVTAAAAAFVAARLGGVPEPGAPPAAGWAAAPVWAVALAGTGLWVWRSARRLLRSEPCGGAPGGGAPCGDPSCDDSSPVVRVLVAVLVVEAVFAVLLVTTGADVPERFYDAQVYHLAVPSLFAMHHKVVGLPNLLHSWFPLGMQMNYGVMWLVAGEPAVRAWRAWLFGLVLFAAYRLGAREGRPWAGLVGACLFAVNPLLVTNSMLTSVDVELCLLILVAALAAREALNERTAGGWSVAAGLLTGAAAAVKPTAAFWAPALVVLPALFGAGPVRGRVLKGAAIAGMALLVVAPWALRNWAETGNPAYPYATGVFRSGRQLDPVRREKFASQAASRVVNGWKDVPKLPWLLTDGNNSDDFLGPVPLILVPVLILHAPAAPAFGFHFGVVAASAALWLAASNRTRYMLATWGLLMLLIAWSLSAMAGRREVLRRASLALLAAIGAAFLAAEVLLWRTVLDPPAYLAGRETARAFLERKTLDSYIDTATRAGAVLPPGARVAMVGESRGLGWTRPFLNHSVYDVQVFEEAVRSSATPQEAAKRLRQRGVSHLFTNDRETSRLKLRYAYPMLDFDPRQRKIVEGLWGGWLSELPGSASYCALWRLEYPKGARKGARMPLTFLDDAMRVEFEGVTMVTWEGNAEIAVQKTVRKP